MNNFNAFYNNTPDPAELSFSARKRRDEDVSIAFEGISNEAVLAVVREAVAKDREQKRLEVWEPALSFERLLKTKLVNKKINL